MSNDRKILAPDAKGNLDKLKMEVANETLGRNMNQTVDEKNYESILDQRKQEAAEELGLSDKIEQVGWKNMTTGEAGKIGGHVGGEIGGNMVKKLITMAESQMAPVSEEAVDKDAIEQSSR